MNFIVGKLMYDTKVKVHQKHYPGKEFYNFWLYIFEEAIVTFQLVTETRPVKNSKGKPKTNLIGIGIPPIGLKRDNATPCQRGNSTHKYTQKKS